ncbi:BrnT family toxin [Rubrivivax gelatinosus]|uniref:Phage-Barnase-EndoU-ColicinE5/D-RelE like nuclease 3 domain-containing protein n=1 Tax=Rubrivivax gelatinosus TaxID=28068 RepID=A0ABS1DTA2_RUBGE|nr:BrnT family toxin [Rubrivivax gelatinosus]MBK1713242.1 hypothetical protein [Rubrivivax gelatinosus]
MEIPSKLGIPEHEFRVILGRSKIDYDPNKEEANRARHGYSLESAVYFLERLLLPTSSPRPHAVSEAFLENGEARHMHMCVDDSGNVVLMVTTMRLDETVRVISLRKAHHDEREEFQQLTGYVQPPR